MKVSHVLYKTNNLEASFKEFEKLGYKVVYGSRKKPHNALIYFSEGPYIELLEKAPVSSFLKAILRLLGKAKVVDRFNSWENSTEGFFEICLENNTTNFKKEEKISEIDSYTQKLAKSVKKKSHRDNAVIVDGMDDLMVRMARCCNPIPGDPILGYITRGRGITVHHSSCNRVEDGELARTVDVEWNSEFSFKHPVNVRVITHDKPGILSLISKAITGIKVNIRSAIAKSLPDRKGSFIFEIEVKDYSELLKTICTIESLEEVISVTRV